MKRMHIIKGLWLLGFMLIGILMGCNKEKFNNFEGGTAGNYYFMSQPDTSIFGNGGIVPITVARAIAERINMTLSDAMKYDQSETIREIEQMHTIADSVGIPVMYIANFVNGGFVIISADERYVPILSVVYEGRYDTVPVPATMFNLIGIYYHDIMMVREEADPDMSYTVREWYRVIRDIGKEEFFRNPDCCPECPNFPDCMLERGIGCGSVEVDCDENDGDDRDSCGDYRVTTRGPLLVTEWGQTCTYNEQVPDLDCSNVCWWNENAFTGCVATAMAQVIRYWEHSCTQGYDFASMPAERGNAEVQRLMADAGESVFMNYSCKGSGAFGFLVDDAFKYYFCFSSAVYDVYEPLSYRIVINNINQDRPVLLDGCAQVYFIQFPIWFKIPYKCHMWVCDGYEIRETDCYSILYFHMNWGWNEVGVIDNYNGWYFYNVWQPRRTNRNYQYAQHIVYNIYP